MSATDLNDLPVPGDDPDAAPKRALGGIVATVVALVLVVGAAMAGVFAFVAEERGREMRAWQTRLAIVADSRVGAVSRWYGERVAGELNDLAANQSLQIYLTQLALPHGAPPGGGEAAQTTYLRNLLVVTAARAGFAEPPSGPDVPANVRRIGVAGIGVYDMTGRAVATTPGMPPLDGALAAFFAGLERGAAKLLDLYRAEPGGPTLGYAAPIYRIQGGTQASEQVGWVIGVRPVARDLFALLAQPGEVNATAENILIRRRGSLIDYLSPLADGSAALSRAFADDTPGLAAAEIAARPGAFVAARDYREHDVLAVSRPVAGLPWLLIAKIDRAEALGPSEARLNRLLTIGLLAVALIAVLAAALWRHGASRRAADAARRFADMAVRFDARGRLLRLVTDSQPNAVYMTDGDGQLTYANQEAARRAGIDAADMIGKSLAAVFGPAPAQDRLELGRRALATGTKQVQTLQDDGGRIIQTTHVPLPAESPAARPVVLVVESDVTEAITERARRERTLNHLVRALMAVVDRRDPFAAHQSERTSLLARALAEEMSLDAVTVRTVEIAGSVMSLGKIVIPAEVLSRSGTLSAGEMRQVRDSLRASADLLAGIEFDGPVVETLRQLQEHWDGSGGPNGRQGEDILLTARVVAVANAFVAMVSPRAWRDGATVDDAVDRLLADVGTVFDRRVVAALISYLDNHGGRGDWERLARVGSPR